MIFILSKQEQELVKRLRALEPVSELTAEVIRLKRELVSLEIDKSKQKEEHAKEERELRHMIGLEKKRQEVEITQAKRETTLIVREENLKTDKARFEEQLKFNTERFVTMEKYLKDMVGQILDRLPNVNLEIQRGGNGKAAE